MADFETGRIKQKLRTRNALIAIAVEQVKKGKTLSVAEVADLAHVGRTTAYRYFPTQTHLLAYAMLTRVANLGEDRFDDYFANCRAVDRRVAEVVAVSDQSIREREPEYREMLRMSLESDKTMPHRNKHRVGWITKAIADLRVPLGKKGFERLAAALGLCVGIESTVVLSDIYDLSPETARGIKLWVAEAILNHALRDIRPGSAAARTGKRRATKAGRARKSAA